MEKKMDFFSFFLSCFPWYGSCFLDVAAQYKVNKILQWNSTLKIDPAFTFCAKKAHKQMNKDKDVFKEVWNYY